MGHGQASPPTTQGGVANWATGASGALDCITVTNSASIYEVPAVGCDGCWEYSREQDNPGAH